MTITADDLRNLRLQLAEAEEEFKKQQKLTRPQVVQRLTDIKHELQSLDEEAKKLAESVGLVFYYSSGYEDWSWMEEEDWSSSSANC